MNKWNIKRFDELSLKQLYEIVRKRCEVFILEQEITCEEELDGIDDKCVHVYLEADEQIIAYCRIVPAGINYEHVSIGRVLVVEEYRRKGFAQEMLKITLEYIKNNYNDHKVILSSQLYAKDLYLSVGFNPMSEVYEEAGIPHLKMCKNIN